MNTAKTPLYRGMIVTDFDGTLYFKEDGVSWRDKKTLEDLSEKGILRALATGRSLYSLRRSLPEDFPLDYIIFSTGLGFLECSTGKIFKTEELSPLDTERISGFLIDKKIDFMIHSPVPENHYFIYNHGSGNNKDFIHRISLYQDFAEPIRGPITEPASQFLIIDPGKVSLVEELSSCLSDFSVIRTTSPLDHSSLWIEVFPKGVCKSLGARLIAETENIPGGKIIALGNDYNDIDLLEWASSKFVSPLAPKDLLDRFPTIAGNGKDFVSRALENWWENFFPED